MEEADVKAFIEQMFVKNFKSIKDEQEEIKQRINLMKVSHKEAEQNCEVGGVESKQSELIAVKLAHPVREEIAELVKKTENIASKVERNRELITQTRMELDEMRQIKHEAKSKYVYRNFPNKRRGGAYLGQGTFSL